MERKDRLSLQGLTCARLAVRQDSTIVPLQNIVDNGERSTPKDVILGCFGPKNDIESKIFSFQEMPSHANSIPRKFWQKKSQVESCWHNHTYTRLIRWVASFSLVWWTTSNNNFNSFCSGKVKGKSEKGNSGLLSFGCR